MTVVQFWNEMYQDLTAPVAFSSGAPSPEVVDVAGRLPAGSRAIDIGCGDGRHALYLAEQGFVVDAIDISPVGIAKTQQFAVERGLAINASVQDIRRYTFTTNYHLIVSLGTLHLVEREYWQPFLQAIQAHTCPGGYNVVGIMTDAAPAPDDQRDYFIGLLKEGELFTYYAGWEIISQRSINFHDEHPGGIRHHHAGDVLLARKVQ